MLELFNKIVNDELEIEAIGWNIFLFLGGRKL
jgi:hypothetical protein